MVGQLLSNTNEMLQYRYNVQCFLDATKQGRGPGHTTPLLVLVIPSTPAPSGHSCQAGGVPTAVPFPMLCILHAEMQQWLGSEESTRRGAGRVVCSVYFVRRPSILA